MGTGAGGLDTDSTTSAKFDMDSVDSNNLEGLDNVDGGKHSSVGRALFSVSLDFHSSCDASISLTSRKISHMDERVVEGGLNMAHTEGNHVLSELCLFRSVVSDLLFLLGSGSFDGFLWWHF